MLDSDIHLKWGHVDFGLVKYATEPWLASSIDRFLVLNGIGILKESVIEIKSMIAISRKMIVPSNIDQ